MTTAKKKLIYVCFIFEFCSLELFRTPRGSSKYAELGHFTLLPCSGRLLNVLKDPSQPPPFSMPSKLLIFYEKAKCYCFTVSCS